MTENCGTFCSVWFWIHFSGFWFRSSLHNNPFSPHRPTSWFEILLYYTFICIFIYHKHGVWTMTDLQFLVLCHILISKIVSIVGGQIIVWGCMKIMLNDNVHWSTHYISMMCWSVEFYTICLEYENDQDQRRFFFFLREEEAIKLDGLNVAQMKELREKAEKHAFQAEVNRMMKLIINSLYKNKEVKSILKEDNSRITNLRP